MTRARSALRVAGAPARVGLIALVRLYRLSLGGWLGGQCRFHPTCSAYAEEAIKVHGALKGSGMTIWRILRCGPFTAGGVDPVPPRRETQGTYERVIHREAQA